MVTGICVFESWKIKHLLQSRILHFTSFERCMHSKCPTIICHQTSYLIFYIVHIYCSARGIFQGFYSIWILFFFADSNTSISIPPKKDSNRLCCPRNVSFKYVYLSICFTFNMPNICSTCWWFNKTLLYSLNMEGIAILAFKSESMTEKQL